MVSYPLQVMVWMEYSLTGEYSLVVFFLVYSAMGFLIAFFAAVYSPHIFHTGSEEVSSTVFTFPYSFSFFKVRVYFYCIVYVFEDPYWCSYSVFVFIVDYPAFLYMYYFHRLLLHVLIHRLGNSILVSRYPVLLLLHIHCIVGLCISRLSLDHHILVFFFGGDVYVLFVDYLYAYDLWFVDDLVSFSAVFTSDVCS